ncbi:MAG TPA: META domain-containing protein [Mycobacteriales bacterium]|jgi:heat shock protein HslJ|nr:META domain-containing protein [Mycobacteriales bacterium]
MRPRPAAGFAAAAVLALGCAACGEPVASGGAPPSASATPAGRDALVHSEWRLVSRAPASGAAVPAAPDVLLYLRDGETYSLNACNDFRGPARVGDGTIDFGDGGQDESDVACNGEELATQEAFTSLARGAVAWHLDGARLVLTAPWGTLTFEPYDVLHPEPGTVTVVEGDRDGWHYRLYAVGSPVRYVNLAAVDPEGRPDGGGGLGAPAPDESGMLATATIAGAEYVFVFGPEGAVRMTHDATAQGPRVELTRYPVPGSPLSIFGGFVSAHHSGKSLTAYDAAGHELEPWTGW